MQYSPFFPHHLHQVHFHTIKQIPKNHCLQSHPFTYTYTFVIPVVYGPPLWNEYKIQESYKCPVGLFSPWIWSPSVMVATPGRFLCVVWHFWAPKLARTDHCPSCTAACESHPPCPSGFCHSISYSMQFKSWVTKNLRVHPLKYLFQDPLHQTVGFNIPINSSPIFYFSLVSNKRFLLL